jgi:multimeric flavodoxin WrbA
MKVVLLSGSPRKGGNTEQVLELCAETIRGEGLEAEIISIGDLNIESCTDCGYCNNHPNCVKRDGLNEIMEKIKSAEGLITASPVYFGTARGDIMSAMQRIGYVSGRNGRWLEGKVGGPIAIARRGGHTSTLQEMLMVFFITGMTVPGSCYWNMVFGREPGDVQQDEEGMRTARIFAGNVAKTIKKLFA